jgi:hypothetical protein
VGPGVETEPGAPGSRGCRLGAVPPFPGRVYFAAAEDPPKQPADPLQKVRGIR